MCDDEDPSPPKKEKKSLRLRDTAIHRGFKVKTRKYKRSLPQKIHDNIPNIPGSIKHSERKRLTRRDIKTKNLKNGTVPAKTGRMAIGNLISEKLLFLQCQDILAMS